MKALSIKQPHAHLIATGIKDVENRSWFTATRGRIYIHTGKIFDQAGYDFMLDMKVLLPRKEDYDLGAIIGEVDIVDCKFRKPALISHGFSSWHEIGMWGYILANPILYDKPIPCRGQLGFFEVDIQDGQVKTEYSPEFRRE